MRSKLNDYVYPQLRRQPHFGPNIKNLNDYSSDRWRYRIGNYRVFYTIDEPEYTVVLTGLELRRDAYR